MTEVVPASALVTARPSTSDSALSYNASIRKDDDVLEPKEWNWGWFNWLWWNRPQPDILKSLEEKFMQRIESDHEGFYVEFDGDFMEDKSQPVRIWTRKIRRGGGGGGGQNVGVPLVMVHGLAAGTAMFAINFDGLAKYSDVYAIDLPGFARSSRNKFSSDPDTAERQFVEALERWRQTVGIEKMNLLGHSFGGYLVTAYSLVYPLRIRHLILADPWGFNDKPPREELEEKYGRTFISFIFDVVKRFNPLAGLRAAGRLSIRLSHRLRSDLAENNRQLFAEKPEDNVTLEYLIHSNMHSPTGEAAFYGLANTFFWAKSPMRYRLHALSPDLPLTAIYGADSWMRPLTTEEFEEARGRQGLTLSTTVDYARHHVYARIEDFNQAVKEAIINQPTTT